VSDPPGQPAALTLHDSDGAIGSIVLGPADAVAVASDLLLTARARLGRLLECPAIESWRALVSLEGPVRTCPSAIAPTRISDSPTRF
jgi:hypothetical protein